MRNLTLKNLMFWPGHMESMSSYPLKQTSCMTEQPLKKGENCTILKMGFTITCNGTSTGNGTAGTGKGDVPGSQYGDYYSFQYN
jgi:hypothetical protein